MNDKPWEESSFIYNTVGKSFGRIIDYQVKVEYIKDSDSQVWRKGDIVKFDNCLTEPYGNHWSQWFAVRDDKKKFWIKKPSIPRYASNKLAMIIGRCRKIKYKYCTFRDYGIILMMLTGPKAGHCRKYWSSKPFRKVSEYNSQIKYKYMLKSLPSEIIELYHLPKEDTNEARNQLVEQCYNFYNGRV